MKIISFLGFNNYTETLYLHPVTSQSVKTAFFQEALVEFYQPDTLYVLLTDTVATKIPRNATVSNWQALQDKLAGNPVKLEPIFNIPESNSPEDGWIIFDKITSCLNQGDRVIFDLTHSFRSIPVVALLAISYLRTVKQVKIEGVLYGAFDPNAKDQPTPTYDLLPMLSLLDWISAADRFTKTGDGKPLAELLKNAIPSSERATDPMVHPLARKLDQTAKIIAQISQAIALDRPLEILTLTEQLEEILQQADASIDQRAKPFGLIADQLLKEYGQFALVDNLESEKLVQNLWLQFQLINWYMARGQVMQGMTLAGEWLLSVTSYRLGNLHLLDHRKQVRFALNNGAAASKGEQPQGPSDFDQAFQGLPDYPEMSQLWSQVSDLRNDLAHVGMRKAYRSAASLEKEAQDKIMPKLQHIAEIFLQSNPV